MIRPVLAVMAGILCGLLGLRQGQRIRREYDTLRRWEQLLRHLCIILREGSFPLPEAFLQAATQPTEADETLRRLAGDMQRHPLASLPQLYTPAGKEGPVLARMLPGLAAGSVESRLLALEQAAEEIALLCSSGDEKARLDARMWGKLGWLAGACLALILL